VKRCGGCKRFNKSEETIPFLSGSTLASIYTLVKCFFDAAVKWKSIEENPVKLEKPAKNNEVVGSILDLDDEDTGIWDIRMTMAALAEMSDELLHLMVHIASAHACRNGELCGLTWDVIRFDKGAMCLSIEKCSVWR
jgi:integrase